MADEIEFFDCVSKRKMKLTNLYGRELWVCYKHPDGQWVTLRQATVADVRVIALTLISEPE